MRNWNSPGCSRSRSPRPIFRLPMRNWNSGRPWSPPPLGSPFLDYLWGIETEHTWTDSRRDGEFLDYLWGIETPRPPRRLNPLRRIFRLPMRNWNRPCNAGCRFAQSIFRLPMRNWNPRPRAWPFRTPSFLDYLWGIETSENRSWPRLFPRIFRLPMRNWNSILNEFPLNIHKQIFRLPMRNWNTPELKLPVNFGINF